MQQCAAEQAGMRPLEGVFVLDFSTLLPGPMATLLLAEAGAEVVKVEHPDQGEELRSYEPKWGADSASFALLNRGKRSIALDLKLSADQARLAPLLARADVLVEQFRPGVMARLGLGYDAVSAVNPGVVYCSITGYGQTGPKCGDAGHDLNYIGDTGLLALSMGSPASPVVPPALIADIGGGAYPAVINILLALQDRQHTGRGRHLDVAMSDNLFPFAFWALGSGLAAGHWPGSGTELLSGGTARYHLYPTRDERYVAVAAIEQRFWDTFCEIIGLEPHLRRDRDDPAATLQRVGKIIAGEGAALWRERFAGRDCCCTVVSGLEAALRDPHFQARGLFRHVLSNDRGDVLPALPVPIDPAYRSPPEQALVAPALGAHNNDYFP